MIHVKQKKHTSRYLFWSPRNLAELPTQFLPQESLRTVLVPPELPSELSSELPHVLCLALEPVRPSLLGHRLMDRHCLCMHLQPLLFQPLFSVFTMLPWFVDSFPQFLKAFLLIWRGMSVARQSEASMVWHVCGSYLLEGAQ